MQQQKKGGRLLFGRYRKTDTEAIENLENKKQNKESGIRILLIFTKYAYLRKILSDCPQGKLDLSMEETGLSCGFAVMFFYADNIWLLNGKKISEKSPVYFYTEKKEKILFILSERKSALTAADFVNLENKETVQIGKDFKNPIFYDCFSLVATRQAEIRVEKEGYALCNKDSMGVYVNEKSFAGKRFLYPGDRVDIYGLHLLILKQGAVCVSFCGTCRVIGERAEEEKSIEPANMSPREAGWMERQCWQEQPLHTGDVEILMPEEKDRQQEEPLFLTLGPSLTMVLPMLLMAYLGSRMMGEGGGGFYYLSVAMSGCSAILTLFWGFASYSYRKHSHRQQVKEREVQYLEYLEKTREHLLVCQRENKEILEQKYPAALFFLEKRGKKPVVLWNRYYRQADFLCLRIGLENVSFSMKIKLQGQRKGGAQEKLAGEAEKLSKEFCMLNQVPAVIDFFENRQMGITGGPGSLKVEEVILQLLMQIAACLCYTEVKTVCFYNKERKRDEEIASCLRWMSHSWSGDKTVRYSAGCEKEAAEILPVLTRELMRESEKMEAGVSLPWYIVLVLNTELIRGESLYQWLTDKEKKYPVSAVFVGEDGQALPKSCECLIEKQKQEGKSSGVVLHLGREHICRREVCLETCSAYQAQRYVRQLAGIRVREKEAENRFPEQVSFLQLYNCRKVQELDSRRRWETARTEERMKAPIGCRMGGHLVWLDVHEKFHGPHGLIAGTTGSGKSELIQTYLLSMAVSFSPSDLNFFMIDYKGGGTGDALRALPHCAGVISNLSGKQIKRAMLAITSENKRRQRLLSSYHVNHIDAYTRLYREEKALLPMPHLLLVIDEFAELKKEEPEFMQEIISLAQVGRSLGVHLILSTQKPAGTVDDKIWSNARFRLCLRVQDGTDSMDMLHNKDAAALTLPGQCYLQIGSHEYYELFQTGYCGGAYQEEGEEKGRTALLSNTGKRMRREEDKKREWKKSQMEALIGYIKETAEQYRYPWAVPLWMDELPDKVFVERLKKKEKVECWDTEGAKAEERTALVLGLCDDPENQCQFTLFYYPALQGHLAVCGGPATGKTTFLQTLLWQMGNDFTPQDVLFLIVDVRQKRLGSLRTMPGCVGALLKKEYTEIFFCHMKGLLAKRRDQLQGVSWEQYNKYGKEKLPMVFLVVDDFGSFKKILDDKQQELLSHLATEGLTLGIYLVLSAAGAGEIGGKLYEKIKTACALEMSDRFLYGDVLRQYHLPVLPKENQKGRGLCKCEGRVLEFQTAMAVEEAGDGGFIENTGIRKKEAWMAEGNFLPEKFPEVPESMDFNERIRGYNWEEGMLPLGYCLSNGELCRIVPDKTHCFLISGAERTGRRDLFMVLAEGLLHMGRRITVFDLGGRLSYLKGRDKVLYLEREGEIDIWQKNLSTNNKEDTADSNKEWKDRKQKMESEIVCVFIADMAKFCGYLYRACEVRDIRMNFWEQAAMGRESIGFIAGIFHPERDYEAAGTAFFREFISWQYGIHLGGNVASQRALSFDDLGYGEQTRREEPGIGYFKKGNGSKTHRIQLLRYGKDNER